MAEQTLLVHHRCKSENYRDFSIFISVQPCWSDCPSMSSYWNELELRTDCDVASHIEAGGVESQRCELWRWWLILSPILIYLHWNTISGLRKHKILPRHRGCAAQPLQIMLFLTLLTTHADDSPKRTAKARQVDPGKLCPGHRLLWIVHLWTAWR